MLHTSALLPKFRLLVSTIGPVQEKGSDSTLAPAELAVLPASANICAAVPPFRACSAPLYARSVITMFYTGNRQNDEERGQGCESRISSAS